jgi:hypothetical protein
MLHHEGSLLGVEDVSLDDLGGRDTLLTVQIGGGLVNLREMRTAKREGGGEGEAVPNKDQQGFPMP